MPWCSVLMMLTGINKYLEYVFFNNKDFFSLTVIQSELRVIFHHPKISKCHSARLFTRGEEVTTCKSPHNERANAKQSPFQKGPSFRIDGLCRDFHKTIFTQISSPPLHQREVLVLSPACLS